MRFNKTTITLRNTLIVATAFSSAVACGKKKKNDSATNSSGYTGGGAGGVTTTNSSALTLSGALALNTASLTDAGKPGVLSYQLAGGVAVGSPDKIGVADDGSFIVNVNKTNDSVDTLIAEAKNSPASRDWDKMYAAVSKIYPGQIGSADDLKKIGEADLQSHIVELANQMNGAGAMTMLVAYNISASGDTTAEAETFHFIGMPTGGRNLSAIPNGDLKGSLNFGDITGSGGDVTASLKAGDAVNISGDALQSLANAGQALKILKNSYMNAKFSVQPFYFWLGGQQTADVIGSFADVSKSSYNGYGFYVRALNGDQGLSYNDLCGGKSITFTPPSAITTTDNGTITAYSNSNQTRSSQGSSQICVGGGFYGRVDSDNGNNSIMLNFGTGGSIASSPAGLWRLAIDGSEVGRYDLALASPVDDARHPLVFMPSVKFLQTGSQITGAQVEFYRWTGSEYHKITDLAAVRHLATQITAGLTRKSDNGEARAKVTIADDGTASASFDSSSSDNGSVVNPPVAVSDIDSASIAYQIGDLSYRIEYRNN